MVVTKLKEQLFSLDEQTFSPLYVGSVVVTRTDGHPGRERFHFQSPIRRVSGCNAYPLRDIPKELSFSPLYVGSVVVTVEGEWG